MLVVILCLSLALPLFLFDRATYADGVALDNPMFRIGIHHGANALATVRLNSSARVEFGLTAPDGAVIPLLADESGGWQIYREAVRLVAGPFGDQAAAAQVLSRWSAGSGPAFILRESAGFMVAGGLFATVEQAVQHLPGLAAAGINGVTVRGMLALVSGSLPSIEAAQAVRERLVSAGLEGRLYFDGAWRIAVGFATDTTLIDSLRVALVAAAPELVWESLPRDFRRIHVISQDGRLLFVYANLSGLTLRAASSADFMSVESRRHRGVFEFTLDQMNRFMVVGLMHVDDYLKSVVPREMPASWHIEALKAQAVVARTYAYANRNRHAALGFDLCHLSTCCQAYGGVEWEHPNSNQAVDETKGVIALFNGRPASTFYHSDSGGHTENVEHVWTRAIPYLIGVSDPFGALAGSTHARWEQELTQAQMQQIARFNGTDVGTVLAVTVESRFPSGRVSTLSITGTAGRMSLRRQQPRLPDGSTGLFALRSTMYTVTSRVAPVVVQSAHATANLPGLQGTQVATAAGVQDLLLAPEHTVRGASVTSTLRSIPSSFVFVGSGWGHGVGMSQWGARGMAELGHSYREILVHYYRGIWIADIPH
ncbi:MAG: Amidase enhancer [Firmicutes bacterium]|nr:Amidase enhancer [Bacillota bacterium]